MKTHKLKTWPWYFNQSVEGRKLFELRKNDRNYKVGDFVILEEWSPVGGQYTGRSAKFKITYRRDTRSYCHGAIGLALVILGIAPIKPCPDCDGVGRIAERKDGIYYCPEHECEMCRGTGNIESELRI